MAEIDFSEFTNRGPISTGVTTFPAGITYSSDPAGGAKSIVDLVKTMFPDYANSTNAKVTNTEPKNWYTLAETGGMLGNNISAGRLGRDSIVSYGDGTTKGVRKEDTIKDTAILLHEIMHTRQNASKETDLQKIGLGDDWKELLNAAEKANFPSIASTSWGGNKLEEFLATAVPLRDMQRRGLKPGGVMTEPAKQLDVMLQQFPWLPKYLDINSMPEVPSLKGWEPGIIQKAKDWLKGITK